MQGQKILRATKSARHKKSAHMLKLKIYKANFAPGHMNEVHVLFAVLYKKMSFFVPICVKIM